MTPTNGRTVYRKPPPPAPTMHSCWQPPFYGDCIKELGRLGDIWECGECGKRWKAVSGFGSPTWKPYRHMYLPNRRISRWKRLKRWLFP